MKSSPVLEGFEFELSRSPEVDISNEETAACAEVDAYAALDNIDETCELSKEGTGIGKTIAVEVTVLDASEGFEVYLSEVLAVASFQESVLEDPIDSVPSGSGVVG